MQPAMYFARVQISEDENTIHTNEVGEKAEKNSKFEGRRIK